MSNPSTPDPSSRLRELIRGAKARAGLLTEDELARFQGRVIVLGERRNGGGGFAVRAAFPQTPEGVAAWKKAFNNANPPPHT